MLSLELPPTCSEPVSLKSRWVNSARTLYSITFIQTRMQWEPHAIKESSLFVTWMFKVARTCQLLWSLQKYCAEHTHDPETLLTCLDENYDDSSKRCQKALDADEEEDNQGESNEGHITIDISDVTIIYAKWTIDHFSKISLSLCEYILWWGVVLSHIHIYSGHPLYFDFQGYSHLFIYI